MKKLSRGRDQTPKKASVKRQHSDAEWLLQQDQKDHTSREDNGPCSSSPSAFFSSGVELKRLTVNHEKEDTSSSTPTTGESYLSVTTVRNEID